MSEFRYKAFISYSHTDEAWARWLHRAIEAYRIPRDLVGTQTAMGEVPARIRPVFRDRDELSSASDLGNTVKQALSDSENLIVLCSPAGAASIWVREEIREFVRLGRRDRIYCVIVDGEASSSGSVAAVFPDAIAEAGMQEPLAADVRKWADGKQLAKLKVISGMLGLPLDQLRRRELQKRRKTIALASVAVLAVVAVLIIAITSRMAAEQRRDSGELLVGYKLNELRVMLSGAADPEKLDRLQHWDKLELAALIAESGSQVDDLTNTATRQREQGIELWQSGKLSAAMVRFNKSWALFAEVYRRDQDNQTGLFELGQAEFWIGQVHLDRGEIDQAETAFLSYAEITRRLIQMQPKNAEWVLEMAYALTNLGQVQNVRKDSNPERMLQFMQSALEYNQIALVLDPDSEHYRSELGQSHANLADAQRSICDLEGALQSRKEGLVMESELLENDRENPNKQKNLALALTGYARIQAFLGRNDEASKNLEKSLTLIRASKQTGQDIRTDKLLAERSNLIIWLDAMSERVDEAWTRSEELSGKWQRIYGATMGDFDTLVDYTTYLLDRAWLANKRGDTVMAKDLLDQSIDMILTATEKTPDNRRLGNTLTLAAYRHWSITGEQLSTDTLSLLPDYRTSTRKTRACTDASMAVRKAVMLGQPEQANDLVAYLLEKGFRESGFMQVCRLYYDCTVSTDAN